MSGPRLYGSDYSVYVRIVRMVLHEKNLSYTLVPVDVFSADGRTPEYLKRQPFGKIPLFEDNGFELYETGAICRYVDEAYDGPLLQPSDAKARARMNQLISIADGYLYPHLVWGLYVELVAKAGRGEAADPERVAKARALAPTCLSVLDGFVGKGAWLAGERFLLADAYVAPMLAYFMLVPGAGEMLSDHPSIERWWHAMTARDSFKATFPTTS